ncbi:uncharacterized protein EDB91DRAFT_1250301 [Suillus paluster]|uniref:uncharacterized protein n=1 Tax=Suillus paluster TaxID=48578 RepID=UPI001B87FD46|nr:uncharacterized protein EDB91DRAFT_1250301 [Suillus paluster]KAG1735670.1 hypothetical protein EDB91DRAFT_1250301 [Suillus paluster]
MSATASMSSRHHTMKESLSMKDSISTLAVDAASCALRRGDVCRAVELLEQGMTLIWTQMARLHAPIDILQERGDHAAALMKKFRDLNSLLKNPPAHHGKQNFVEPFKSAFLMRDEPLELLDISHMDLLYFFQVLRLQWVSPTLPTKSFTWRLAYSFLG